MPLARAFIARTCTENACGPCALSSEVLDLLTAYDWPGNVRELENAIERAKLKRYRIGPKRSKRGSRLDQEP